MTQEIGKPKHFDLEQVLKTAQMHVDSDSVIKGIEYIRSNLPAYYRNKNNEIINQWMKNVFGKVATIHDYAQGELVAFSKEAALEEFKQMRFQVTRDLVKHWNDQNRKPHITELGPGMYTLPIGLQEEGLDFSYTPLSISAKPHEHQMVHIEKVYQEKPSFHQPEIFTCFEMIEHLWEDPYYTLSNYYHRYNVNAEHVLISTPNGALGGGWARAQADLIAHVRDLNPDELYLLCREIWGWLDWKLMDGPQMLAIGSRING